MPSFSFITTAQLKQYVADAMHVGVATLPPEWDRICFDANSAAFLDIQGAFIQRGFSFQQLTGFDRGAEYQRWIGMYWSFVNGAGLHGYDDKWIAKFDRRKELMTVLVTVGGGVLQDMSGIPQPIQAGNMNWRDDRYWGYVTHWGYGGCYFDRDIYAPYPPGTGYIG